MRQYKRLDVEEREEISRMLAQGQRISLISRVVGRSKSTISREIRRDCGNYWHYRANQAARIAREKASKRRRGKRKLFLNPELAKIVQSKLRLFWSPEQIAQWLQKEYADRAMHVSHETIYSYLYVLPRGKLREELLRTLRREHKYRRKHGRTAKGQPAKLEDMLSIEERPKEVEDRIIPGHWEGDLLVGGQKEQTVLGTLVERTTRTVILVPLKGKSAKVVRQGFAREIKKLPKQMRLSLTYDQGREMAEHKLLTRRTEMKVYFAHPQSPWERGTNENTNGLIRQFFPKGTDFRKISRYKIKKVQDLLNGRPRKALDFKTPFEAMQELLQ